MSFKSIIVSRFVKTRHKSRYTDEAIKDTINEIIWYLIFLVTVNTVTFLSRSVLTYYFSNTIDRLFLKRIFYTTSDIEINYDEIVTIDDWWNFMENSFIGGIYTNGKSTVDITEENPRSTNDYLTLLRESIFLGPPRLRQLKVRNNSCNIHSAFKRYFRNCHARYSYFIDEREKDITETGYFTWGKLGFYRGGGSAKYFTVEQEANERLLDSLKNSGWIELGTRLIVVEFSLYNANANLFCVVKFFVELPPVGGVVPSFSIRTFEMLNVGSRKKILLIITKVFLLIQLIIYTIREGITLYQMKLKYFKYFWNWISICIIGTGIFIIIFEIFRSVVMAQIISMYNLSPGKYVDMDGISFWQYHADNAMALICFFVWIEIFKYISFNKTMLQFSMTLRQSAQDLLGFGVMFAIVFIAFAQLGYLLFGTMNKDFKTMTDSVFTMMRTILGDFEYLAIEDANRILGPIFFMTYIFFVFFVLLNMFLAIINGTYTEVKAQVMEDDIQIWNYIKRNLAKFCKCFCCGREIYKYSEVKKNKIPETISNSISKGNADSKQPNTDGQPIPPTRINMETNAEPSTSSKHSLSIRNRIVVRRKDLIGKLFTEIDSEKLSGPSQPAKEDNNFENHLNKVEERLHNLEAIMDTFVIRINNLILKLDAEEDTRGY